VAVLVVSGEGRVPYDWGWLRPHQSKPALHRL